MTDQSLAIIKRVLTSTDIMHRFATLMGERESAYYINSVILTVANSEDLQKCTPNSIVFSALRAASLKLSCDQALGEAYLVPFHNSKKDIQEAVFIPGYKGLRNLATRTNKYRFVHAGQVYNGEQMSEDRLTGQMTLIGKRLDDTIIGWFAYFEMFSGYSKVLYMTVEEIHDHAKQYSKTYSSKKSLWQTDPQKAEKKTVLRLLLVRWGDLGEAGNAFKDDEILDSDFQIVIPNEETPKTRRPVAQNLRDLGYEDEPEPVNTDAEDNPQSPQPEPAAAETRTASGAPMTLAEAQDMTNRDGLRYGDLDNAKLSYMVNSLAALPARTPEQESKMLAIQLIFVARNKEATDQAGG